MPRAPAPCAVSLLIFDADGNAPAQTARCVGLRVEQQRAGKAECQLPIGIQRRERWQIGFELGDFGLAATRVAHGNAPWQDNAKGLERAARNGRAACHRHSAKIIQIAKELLLTAFEIEENSAIPTFQHDNASEIDIALDIKRQSLAIARLFLFRLLIAHPATSRGQVAILALPLRPKRSTPSPNGSACDARMLC